MLNKIAKDIEAALGRAFLRTMWSLDLAFKATISFVRRLFGRE